MALTTREFRSSAYYRHPKASFLEATGQLFRGDSNDVFHSSRRSDVSTVAHLRGYKDISESTNLDLGASYARGHNDLGTDFITSLLRGGTRTVRWKPLRRFDLPLLCRTE